jgi:hypothetical protein
MVLSRQNLDGSYPIVGFIMGETGWNFVDSYNTQGKRYQKNNNW